jgi:hypothetical protein
LSPLPARLSHPGERNFLACFAVKNNRKGNTKFFARPTGIIRAGKDHKEIQWVYPMFCRPHLPGQFEMPQVLDAPASLPTFVTLTGMHDST